MPVGRQLRARVSFTDSALSVEADVPGEKGEHCKRQEVSMHHVRSGGMMRKRWSRGKSRKANKLIITIEEEEVELEGG